jgi:replicative DNA helicase
LDGILSGFQPSDLLILAARPSMGKTAFALNIAQNIAMKGKKIAFFSLEMAKEQLVERMFCGLMEVDSWKLRTGQLDKSDFNRMGDVLDKLSRTPIFIDDAADCNMLEIRTKCRRLQAEHGVDMIVIDYLQLIRGSNPNLSAQNRVLEISEISRSLKAIARELQVPIIALSQLSRGVEMRTDKIPQLADLRDSGSIEQDADVVMFMYRDDYYHPDTSDCPGVTEVHIKKHRNGPIGKIELNFNKSQMKSLLG